MYKEEKDKKKNRITFIDTAKAIAMFLTIVSHSGLGANPINRWICSFHMPLFFFITGWTQKNKSLSGFKEWKDFIFKKIYTLLGPYILFSFIAAKIGDLDTYKNIFYGTIFSLNKANSIGVMWFLTCMFSSVIIYQIIINIRNSIKNTTLKNIIFYLILILCGITSGYFNCNRVPNLGIPFNLNIALSAVLFMFAGNGISKLYNLCINKYNILKKKSIVLIPAIIIIIIGILTYRLNTSAYTMGTYDFGVVMAEAWYGNYIIFLINAIICSTGIVLLSMVIDNKILAYIGRNTLIILYFHIQALSITNTYIISKLSWGIYAKFLKAILVFLETSLLIPIINTFFPILSGKYYPIKE